MDSEADGLADGELTGYFGVGSEGTEGGPVETLDDADGWEVANGGPDGLGEGAAC